MPSPRGGFGADRGSADQILTAVQGEGAACDISGTLAGQPGHHVGDLLALAEPADRRKIITSHDAFGYFGAAYGLELLAPEGVSTESEATAADVAGIIRQVREEAIPAIFVENIKDRRLIDQIAAETRAMVGGELHTDALSAKDGPAPTYIDMIRHNVGTLTETLTSKR